MSQQRPGDAGVLVGQRHGRDRFVVEEKARMQHAAWDEQWERNQEGLTMSQTRRDAAALKEENDRLANLRC